MEIRRAIPKDIPELSRLLCQVLTVHSNDRPDIFKKGTQKYTAEELSDIIKDDTKPIFVAISDYQLVGYAFCIFIEHKNHNILCDVKSLYIDDLCVDENSRGQHIGTELYEYVKKFAKSEGCYNVTLNVWACNSDALSFYEKLGLKAQKIGMEQIL